jgi:hypothetical protein
MQIYQSSLKALSLGSLVVSFLLFSQPANADSGYRSAPTVPPSSETRVIRNSQFGFRFSVPANYQVVSKTDSYAFGDVTLIFVLDPSEFESLECLRKSGEAAEINSEPIIGIRPVYSKGLDILGHIKAVQKQEDPVLTPKERVARELSTHIRMGTVAKQSAAFANYVGKNVTRIASFLTPDRNYAVVVGVTYIIDAQGKITATSKLSANKYQQILDTFSFEK